jgi:hypothetical protein
VITRAYSICRRCAAVFPDGRRCPACDGDEIAARAIAAATAHAIEQAPAGPLRRRSSAALAAAGLFALILALGAAVAAIAAPGGDAKPSSISGSGGSAAQVHQ